jgi:hypothetical protein
LAHNPWDVSQNVQMVQPKFKAVICRETEGGKVFSDFYFLESKSDENYHYLSNTLIDGKGVKTENVKKVLKKNVYSIYPLVHTDTGTNEGGEGGGN